MSEYKYPPEGTQAGTVIGPGSSTDNAVARFNGTTGESVQNSGVIISDTNAMTGISSAEVTGDVTVFNGTAQEFLLGKEAFEQSSTGCNSFSGFTNNTTTFDVGAGEGHIADHTGLAYYDLSWGATTGHSPLTANGVTYVYIDNTGAVSLTTTVPTPVSRREKVLLGRVATIGGNIASIQSMVQVSFDVSNSIGDLSYAIRIFNVEGNILSANGANLRLNKSAGSLFSYGANFLTDDNNPHQVTTGSATAATFAYITQLAGSTGSNTQDVVPGSYDVAGTVTAIAGSSNQATIQRVYLFPSGNIRIAYGQTVYATLSAALQGVSSEAFTVNPSVPGNGVLIGLLVLTKGCTDLTNTTTARFLAVSRFGETSVGAAGQSVSSLQNAYDNSITPEITTDSTRGAVSIKRGSAADTDVVLEVQNGAGSNVFTVDGEGDVAISGNTTFTGTVNLTTTAIAEGTNLYYTDERAQDAIGTILTDTNDIDLTYDDGTPSITADLRSSSITAKTEVTADVADFVMISDTSDSGNLKKADLGDFLLPSASQVITNKDIDGGTASNTSRLTVPKDTYANLLSLTRKEGTLLYATDLDTFFADDGSTLTAVGSGGGSGSGTLNIVDNPSATSSTTGWTAATNYTVTRNTANSPLAGVIDSCFAIATSAASSEAATSGVYAASLAMPVALRNTKAQVSLYLTTPATSDGVWRLSVYNASSTRMSLSSDSSSVTTLPASFNGQFVCTFDADSSATYTISLTQTTRTNANTLYVTNISIGNGITAQGAAVSEWQSFTLSTALTNEGTLSNTSAQWRRVGSDMEVRFATEMTSNPAGQITFTPPVGTVDTSKLSAASGTDSILGSAKYLDSGVATYVGSVVYTSGTGIRFFANGAGYISTGSPFVWAAADNWTAEFRIPIAEWAGSGTVNLGQGAQDSYYSGAITSDDNTTTTIYGPAGSRVPTVALSVTRYAEITLQYPRQTNTSLLVEVDFNGDGGWTPYNAMPSGSFAWQQQNSRDYGIYITPVSSTVIRVNFAQYSFTNGATYGAAGQNWSAHTNAKWRLRVFNPSAPVGFGRATATDTGLVFRGRWQNKTLSANVNGNGSEQTISGLSFSNLTIGKTYRVSGYIYLTTSTTNHQNEVRFFDGTSSGTRIGSAQMNPTWSSGVTSDDQGIGVNFLYTATTTSMTTTYSAGNSASTSLVGNNTKARSFIQIEEVDIDTTTAWT